MATDSARSTTDSVESAKRIDMVKTAISWLLKFVRYIVLNDKLRYPKGAKINQSQLT